LKSSKQKVLHVAPRYLPHVGGSSVRLKNLLEPIADKVETYILVCREDRHGNPLYSLPVNDEEEIQGIKVHRVARPAKLASAARTLCHKESIDTIQIHSLGLVPYMISALPGRRLILDIHTLASMSRAQLLVARLAFSWSSAVVTLSYGASQYINQTHGVKKEKIVIIRNGVDPESFYPGPKDSQLLNRLGLENKTIVGYLGSFYNFQGVEEFFESAKTLLARGVEEVKFLMVGGGPDLDLIRKRVREAGLNKEIVLTGEVPMDHAATYLNLMDIFVIARPALTETETAVPLKVLEAMALEKAIVATAVGGLTEVLTPGQNAILVEPNTTALADGITVLLDDINLRGFLGKNAREAALKMSWQQGARLLLNLYESVGVGK
jgi:glycosyltransferase involved in cell wall biosynthesis